MENFSSLSGSTWNSSSAPQVERDVADFVDQHQVETAVAGDEAGEAAFFGGFDELVDELGAGGVADSAGLFAGGDAKSDQQMGLARARR